MNNVLEDSLFVSQNRKFDEIQSIVRQFSAEYVGNSIIKDKKKNTRLGERIRKIFSTRRVFHSAGMCLLEAEGFYPCGQVGFAGIGVEHLTMQQLCTGAARRKFFIGLTHAAAAGGSKGDDGLTF